MSNVSGPRKTGEKVLDALRAYAPVKVIAYASESEEDAKPIAVPNVRNRWQRITATLDKIPWVKLELLDKTGALLATIENREPAREMEDLPISKAHAEHALALRIVELVSKERTVAVEQVLGNRDSEMKALLAAQASVLKEMSTAMHSLTESYRELAAVKEESAETRAEAELAAQAASGGFNVKELMEAMPLIMQALPILRGLLTGGDAPNGHAKQKGA